MNNIENRAQYVKSLEYKMVFILSGYRKILLVLGTDFLNYLKDYRISNGRASGLQYNSMLLIDAGYESLTLDEVRLYTNYIAKILNYDENEFFECLKDKAYRYEYNDDDHTKMTKIMIHIMHQIDKNMA